MKGLSCSDQKTGRLDRVGIGFVAFCWVKRAHIVNWADWNTFSLKYVPLYHVDQTLVVPFGLWGSIFVVSCFHLFGFIYHDSLVTYAIRGFGKMPHYKGEGISYEISSFVMVSFYSLCLVHFLAIVCVIDMV